MFFSDQLACGFLVDPNDEMRAIPMNMRLEVVSALLEFCVELFTPSHAESPHCELWPDVCVKADLKCHPSGSNHGNYMRLSPEEERIARENPSRLGSSHASILDRGNLAQSR